MLLSFPVTYLANDTAEDIGALNMYQMLDGLKAFTTATFTGILGWTIEEVQAFLSRVRKDAKDRSVHMMHDLYVSCLP